VLHRVSIAVQAAQLYGKGYNELTAAEQQVVQAKALEEMALPSTGHRVRFVSVDHLRYNRNSLTA
jgi:hypothetical protein